MRDTCPNPKCGRSLLGEPIPQHFIERGYYGPRATHYRLEHGVNVRGVYDGVLFWVDPECGYAWPRQFDSKQRSLTSMRYAHQHNLERGSDAA